MAIPLIICDDSSLARKQMLRALPTDREFDVTFACNGLEALRILKEKTIELIILDLTMPVMDGFELLEVIKRESYPVKTIVVTGDIQPESHNRVMALGAIAFIKKPFAAHQITQILEPYYENIKTATTGQIATPDVKVTDVFQEIANIAMGRAADLLANFLNVFVVMPIPHINLIHINELQMIIDHGCGRANAIAVTQGFISPEISGEGLMIFNNTRFEELAEILNYEGQIDMPSKLEIAMDVTSLLLGAIMKSIGDQLDLKFAQDFPVLLDENTNRKNLLVTSRLEWKETMAVELAFSVKNTNINCDFLLVLTRSTISSLNKRLSYLMD